MRLASGSLAALLAVLVGVAQGQTERGSTWRGASAGNTTVPNGGYNPQGSQGRSQLGNGSQSLPPSSSYRPGSLGRSNQAVGQASSLPLGTAGGSYAPGSSNTGGPQAGGSNSRGSLILNNTIRNNTIRNNAIRNNAIRNNAVRNNAIRNNALQNNAIQNNTYGNNSIQNNGRAGNTTTGNSYGGNTNGGNTYGGNTNGGNTYGGNTYGAGRTPGPNAVQNRAAGNRPGGAAGGTNLPSQRPVPSRQATFSIPFQVPSRSPDTVVELHVSADRGANWYVYSRQRPEVGRFQFTSRRDGEYWFASRTINRAQPAPQGPVQPQLRMLIDTTRPRLNIDATADVDGRVNVSWKAFDKNLEASTLKLEFQSEPNSPWKPIPQSPQNRVDASQLDGNVVWSPQPGSSSILVRVEIRDIAGNIAAATHRLVMPRTAQNGADSALVKRSTPGAIEWNKGGDGNAPRRDPIANKSTEKPTDIYQPVIGNSNPPVQNQYRPPVATGGLPAGQNAQWTTSQKFMLDYNVDAAGSQGVSSVELWGTRDGGSHWQQWGTDEDRRSPMPVQVDRAGVYGFRIVVVGKNGLASDKPRAGDMADIWIAVDQTKPLVRLISAAPGVSAEAGAVVITWQASDDQLHSAPITLQYRRPGTTAWTDIVRGQANAGRYVWQPREQLPREIALRIVAKDQAGNIGEDTKSGVRLQQTPSGRIDRFSPVGQ